MPLLRRWFFLSVLVLCVTGCMDQDPLDASDDNAGLVLVGVNTELGQIQIEVDIANSPIAANNFLNYVDAGWYANSGFYRVIPRLNLIEGGVYAGQALKDGHFDNVKDRLFEPAVLEPPSESEKVIKRGSVALAHIGDGRSVQAEFLLFVDAAPSVHYRQQEDGSFIGVKHFGEIVKGIDIVDAMYGMEIQGETNFEWGQNEILTDQVKIISIERL